MDAHRAEQSVRGLDVHCVGRSLTISPRVTVVIPTHQGESRIGAALSRLGQQTLTDFEIIVVNDGSSDNTSAIVARHIHSDSRIRLVEQSRKGIAGARNRGVREARTDVVAFLDDDDLWHPRKLELQLAQFDASADAAVVSCYSALVDPDGQMLGWRWGGATKGNVYREMLEWDMVSGGSVAVVSRRALEEAGGFDESLPDRADWDLWIRLARRHHFAFVPRALVGYTRRDGSVSRNYERMIQQGQAVLNKARQDDPNIGDSEFRAYAARDLFGTACLCIADGDSAGARKYISCAFKTDARVILAYPRRLGVIGMVALSSALPKLVYEQMAMAAVSRLAFRIPAGAPFASL